MASSRRNSRACFCIQKAPLNDSFRGACLFFSEVTLLYYLVKLKALRIAGNKLVVDSFAQSFKNGNVVFTVNVAVDTVLHTVLQHQISKAGVLRARKERWIVKSRNYLLRLHFMCLLQGKLQADSLAVIDFSVGLTEAFGRWQQPSAGAADSNILCHNAVVLQKFKMSTVTLLHFAQAAPPVIMVAAQQQLASRKLR